jgi:hypothetical protein
VLSLHTAIQNEGLMCVSCDVEFITFQYWRRERKVHITAFNDKTRSHTNASSMKLAALKSRIVRHATDFGWLSWIPPTYDRLYNEP